MVAVGCAGRDRYRFGHSELVRFRGRADPRAKTYLGESNHGVFSEAESPAQPSLAYGAGSADQVR